jgi:hypothetical protein
MDIYNIFYMEHHEVTATRSGSLKRSSSFKKLLKLPIWGSGEREVYCVVTIRAGLRLIEPI